MRWSVWSGLLAVLIPAAAGAGSAFRITPEPAWAIPARLPAAPGSPADSSRGGFETILDDEQHNATLEPFEVFRHFAMRVVNEQGVDAASQFQFSFDPL